MKSRRSHLVILAVSLCAGLGDFLAGVFLLVGPAWTLSLLATPVPADAVFVRYLGVFVGMVGLAYFYGIASWKWSGAIFPIRVVWEVTALFRLAVALFLAAAMAAGQLPLRWAFVAGIDAEWALLQLLLISMGFFPPDFR